MSKSQTKRIEAQRAVDTARLKQALRAVAPVRRQTVLDEAAEIVQGRAESDYGHPRDNFQAIADAWQVYLGVREQASDGMLQLSPRDVAMMNALQKIMRDANAPKRDNLVDLAGYARAAERVDE